MCFIQCLHANKWKGDSQIGIKFAKEKEKIALSKKVAPYDEEYKLDERSQKRKLRSDLDCAYDEEFPKVYIKRYQGGINEIQMYNMGRYMTVYMPACIVISF